MNKKRPVNLDLTTIKLPLPAIVSIMHRLSGLLLFISIPFILYLFEQSLRSADSFMALQAVMSQAWVKLGVLVVLVALLYHMTAGIRHLLMDLGIGETIEAGRRSAVLVMVFAIILTLLTGIWLW